MQDLSSLLSDPINALAPTSQAGGNQIVSNTNAMTAPGSVPAQPATSLTGEVLDHVPPTIVASGAKIPPGTDGKRQAKGEDWSPPGAPSWTTPPAHSN